MCPCSKLEAWRSDLSHPVRISISGWSGVGKVLRVTRVTSSLNYKGKLISSKCSSLYLAIRTWAVQMAGLIETKTIFSCNQLIVSSQAAPAVTRSLFYSSSWKDLQRAARVCTSSLPDDGQRWCAVMKSSGNLNHSAPVSRSQLLCTLNFPSVEHWANMASGLGKPHGWR